MDVVSYGHKLPFAYAYRCCSYYFTADASSPQRECALLRLMGGLIITCLLVMVQYLGVEYNSVKTPSISLVGPCHFLLNGCHKTLNM